ncbi:hypothetical protein DFQ26_000475 [Actinomortierella ambigua]|nr:hypothetical protein DFQ26_000475 [Actinomortierella ambigua]
MRFIDIYYLKPWTGIRSYYNGQHSSHQVRSQPSTAGSESKEGEECEESSDAHEWLMWDKERLRTELWASVRKLPNVSHGASEPRGVAVATIVPYALVYIIVGDALLLSITDARITDLDRLSPTARQILLATVGGATIALMMLYFFYLILFGWVIVTRQQIIYPSEWTMTSHRFPLFATDPADFWSQWHTLFKFVWVDFAYFPLRRLAQRFMDSSRTGSRALSKALELALPVLGVFFLSGVSHGFCIWAAWRAPPSSQMNYFLVQGLAVIVTKGFQQSSPGRRWSRVYHSQSERRRKWIDRAGMIAMVVFHILTAPPFIEPYARHEVWLGHRSRSVLWHLFVKHWA